MRYYILPSIIGFLVMVLTLAGIYFGTKIAPLPSYLIAINLAAYALMFIDKSNARFQSWRVPELLFYFLVLIGGGAGVLLGMNRFRHKTRKASFQLPVVIVILIQIVLLRLYFI